MIRHVLSATVFFGALLATTTAQAQTYEKLHSFAGAPLDGATPYGAMIQTADGTFYGTTVAGGADDCGTVFTMDGSGAAPVILHSMTQAEGCAPMAALLLANDGFFYGTAASGGAHSHGTVFRMNLNGDVTVVHDFDDTAFEGRAPFHGVIQATDGLLYGTTFRRRRGR